MWRSAQKGVQSATFIRFWLGAQGTEQRDDAGGAVSLRIHPGFPLSVAHGTTTMSHRRGPDHYRVKSSWLSLAPRSGVSEDGGTSEAERSDRQGGMVDGGTSTRRDGAAGPAGGMAGAKTSCRGGLKTRRPEGPERAL